MRVATEGWRDERHPNKDFNLKNLPSWFQGQDFKYVERCHLFYIVDKLLAIYSSTANELLAS